MQPKESEKGAPVPFSCTHRVKASSYACQSSESRHFRQDCHVNANAGTYTPTNQNNTRYLKVKRVLVLTQSPCFCKVVARQRLTSNRPGVRVRKLSNTRVAGNAWYHVPAMVRLLRGVSVP